MGKRGIQQKAGELLSGYHPGAFDMSIDIESN
jgi:hypothetical protein